MLQKHIFQRVCACSNVRAVFLYSCVYVLCVMLCLCTHICLFARMHVCIHMYRVNPYYMHRVNHNTTLCLRGVELGRRRPVFFRATCTMPTPMCVCLYILYTSDVHVCLCVSTHVCMRAYVWNMYLPARIGAGWRAARSCRGTCTMPTPNPRRRRAAVALREAWRSPTCPP